MIKYNGQDLADIKYNGASIKRVMKDGVQIWPDDTPPDVPNIPTGIQLSEYDIVENIDWDYTKMYIGEGENVNLVTLYFTGQDADVTSIPSITDWVLDPFNVVNTVTVYTDRVELLVNTAFDSSSSVTINYTPGVNPLKDIDGVLLTELNDQPLINLL